MKRGLTAIIFISLILIPLAIPLANAFSFQDVNSLFKNIFDIVGKAIYSPTQIQPTQPAQPETCKLGDIRYYTCPDGFQIQECFCQEPKCKPICKEITITEPSQPSISSQAISARKVVVWQDSCTGQLIKETSYSSCIGHEAVCKAIGTRSEGWYDSYSAETITTKQLIKYDQCAPKWNCIESPELQCVGHGFCYSDVNCKENEKCQNNQCIEVVPINITNPCIEAGGTCKVSCLENETEAINLSRYCNVVLPQPQPTTQATSQSVPQPWKKCCVPKSLQGYLNVQTTKDEYVIGEAIELTDPPASEPIQNAYVLAPTPYNYQYLSQEEKEKLLSRADQDILPFDRPLLERYEKEGIELPSFEPPKYKGYIIQFKELSIIEYKKQIQKDQIETKGNIFTKLYKTITGQAINEATYKQQLQKTHAKAKQDISRMTGKAIMNEFYLVFNGLSIDLSDEQAKEIEKLPYVKKVYKNYEVKALLNESIPLINADKVWQLPDPNPWPRPRNLTGVGIKIAIIDTGVDYTHPDLGGCFGQGCKVEGGYDIVNNDNDPMDDHGHGTHCASIAAGTGAASQGKFKGVAPDATLYAYKVLASSGFGYEDWIIEGIERAVEDNVDVISMSLGIPPGYFDDCYELALSQVVDNAVESGVIVSVAAGNSGPSYGTIAAPGCARKVITVGASDKQDQIAWFSSRGSTNFRIKPDVVAPGVNICAARASQGQIGEDCYNNQGTYVSLSGTSMATPHVAGAAALIKQAHPDWSPDEVKMVMRNTAIDIDEDILTQGYGRIDALAEIQSEKQPIAILNTSGVVSGKVDIIGYVYADNFQSYRLEYGKGIEPTEWHLIVESNAIPTSRILYSGFDTTNLEEETKYSLRLIVRNTRNQASEDYSIIFPVNDPPHCHSCEGCTIKLNSPSPDQEKLIVTLTNNLISDKAPCIKIKKDNVIFDCNNHKISKEDINSYYRAIQVVYRDNVTVKNCIITNFTMGYLGAFPYYHSYFYGINLQILNNTFINNDDGIRFNAYGSVMKNNNFYGTKRLNFLATGAENSIDITNKIDNLPVYYFNNIQNQVISGIETKHLQFVDSENITILNLNMLGGDGVYLERTNNSSIINNFIYNGAQNILLLWSSNNLIQNNTLKNPYWDNIRLVFSSDKNIIKNNFLEGGFYGISLAPSKENCIEKNKIFNSYLGMYIVDEKNRIKENEIYNSTNGFFITEEANQTIIQHNIVIGSMHEDIIAYLPIELSYNNQGNYWGRNQYPFFCEYGNQNATCIDNWDSNREDVIDPCPYNQSYPPGQWPPSPVCPEIIPENKSLINNTGNTTISGYLLMKVQKKVYYQQQPTTEAIAGKQTTLAPRWIDVAVVVNDFSTGTLREILPQQYLALDTIWNEHGGYVANEMGNFRVYAALLDSQGKIIETQQGKLEDSYEFKVTYQLRPPAQRID